MHHNIYIVISRISRWTGYVLKKKHMDHSSLRHICSYKQINHWDGSLWELGINQHWYKTTLTVIGTGSPLVWVTPVWFLPRCYVSKVQLQIYINLHMQMRKTRPRNDKKYLCCVLQMHYLYTNISAFCCLGSNLPKFGFSLVDGLVANRKKQLTKPMTMT